MFIELMISKNASSKSTITANADTGNHGARSRRTQRGTRYSASVASPRFH